jgi:hypothetical protein
VPRNDRPRRGRPGGSPRPHVPRGEDLTGDDGEAEVGGGLHLLEVGVVDLREANEHALLDEVLEEGLDVHAVVAAGAAITPRAEAGVLGAVEGEQVRVGPAAAWHTELGADRLQRMVEAGDDAVARFVVVVHRPRQVRRQVRDRMRRHRGEEVAEHQRRRVLRCTPAEHLPAPRHRDAVDGLLQQLAGGHHVADRGDAAEGAEERDGDQAALGEADAALSRRGCRGAAGGHDRPTDGLRVLLEPAGRRGGATEAMAGHQAPTFTLMASTSSRSAARSSRSFVKP